MRAVVRSSSMLLSAIAAAAVLAILPACSTATATDDDDEGGEGEGEGAATAEGEGETFVETTTDTPAQAITFGTAPSGYGASQPAGATSSCTSAQYWQFGDSESEKMHPGMNCIDCHTSTSEGPQNYTAAGTVHAALDDSDDCRGVPGVGVDILNADGAIAFSTTTNSAGNFFFSRTLPDPYTVRLTYEGRSRFMYGGQSSGQCASCHTDAGLDGAPGRIVAP